MLVASNNTFASFLIAAQSAVSTAQICYCQARKDSLKLRSIATHPEAIKTYRSAWNALVIACQVTILLGMMARDGWEWFKRWSDAYVLACQEQPIAPAADELTEPELTPELEEATPAGISKKSQSGTPDFEPAVPDVQVDFEPAVEPNPYAEMSRRDLLAAAKGRLAGYSRMTTETLRQRLTELHRLG